MVPAYLIRARSVARAISGRYREGVLRRIGNINPTPSLSIGRSSTPRDVPAIPRFSNASRFSTALEPTGPYPTQFTRRPAKSTLWSRLTFLCPPDLDQLTAGWASARLDEGRRRSVDLERPLINLTTSARMMVASVVAAHALRVAVVVEVSPDAGVPSDTRPGRIADIV